MTKKKTTKVSGKITNFVKPVFEGCIAFRGSQILFGNVEIQQLRYIEISTGGGEFYVNLEELKELIVLFRELDKQTKGKLGV